MQIDNLRENGLEYFGVILSGAKRSRRIPRNYGQVAPRDSSTSLGMTIPNPDCISCRTDRFLLMIPAFLLVFSAAAYRITTGLLIHSGATWLSNFTPLAAIALCSAVYFPKKYKFSIPLVTLFISDAVINFSYGAPLLDSQILVRYVALVVVGCAGLLLQNRASLKTLLPASIVGSTFFYAVTNASSWVSDPGYAKNLFPSTLAEARRARAPDPRFRARLKPSCSRWSSATKSRCSR